MFNGLTLRSLLRTAAILLILTSMPAIASAAYDAQEFITYGGFDIITKAFKAVALIGSDGGYERLYVSLILLAIAIIGSYAHIASALGGKIDFFEWLKTFWWAILFYFILVVPTGTVTVYDNVKNRSEIISDVPLGIVMAAGLTNKIEVYLRTMVETAVNPLIPQEFAANGVGYDMFSGVYNYTKNMKWEDEYDRLNLDKYISDCFNHAVVAGDVTPELVRSNNDFISVLEPAAYPLIYTVQYSSSMPQGETTTCSSAFNDNIQNKLTPTYWSDRFKSFCFHAGYDADNIQEYSSCRDIVEQNLQYVVGLGSTASAESFIMQMAIAERINKALLSGNYADAVALTGTRETGMSMVGSGLMLNQFIPIARNMIIAITILSSPLIFLFFAAYGVPTFKYWLSGFAFIATWGVIDVGVEGLLQNYAYNVYSMVRSNQLGFASLFLFDEESAKILAVLGFSRGFGATMALGITRMAFGVINDASQIAQRVQGQAEVAGKRAGHDDMTVEGHGAKIKSLEGSMATMSNAAVYSTGERVKAATYQGARGYEGSLQTMSKMESGPNGTARRVGGMDAYNTHRGVTSTETLNNGGYASERMGVTDSINQATSAEATEKKVKELGGVGQAIKMLSDSVAKQDVSNAKATSLLIAGYAGLKGLTDDEASSFAINAIKNIEENRGHYRSLAKELGYKDDEQGWLQAAATEHSWKGAKDSAKADAVLNDGARSMIANDIGNGLDSNDVNRYQDLLKNSSSAEAFRSAVNSDKKLQSIDDHISGGNSNADLTSRTFAFTNMMEQKRGNLANQMGGFEGITDVGKHQQTVDSLNAWGVGDDREGRRQFAKFQTDGLMSDRMAESANRQWAKEAGVDYKQGVGPYKSGMKVDDWKVGKGEDGNPKLMINKASIQEGGLYSEVSNGAVTERGGIDTGTETGRQYLQKLANYANADPNGAHGKFAADLHERIAAGKAGRGEVISVETTYGQNGNWSGSKAWHGGEMIAKDISSVESLKSKTDLNKITKGKDIQIGNFEQYGSRATTYNEDAFQGSYKGIDGKNYYGQFQYAKDDKGASFIVSGAGTNLQNYSISSSQVTPDGKNIDTVKMQRVNQAGKQLSSHAEAGDTFIYDKSKTFSGGYKYDNYLSAAAEEKGFDRTSQGLGRVKGMVNDVGQYLNIKSWFSSPNKEKK